MKLISKQLLLHIAITAMAFPALGNAANRESTTVSQRDLYAKLKRIPVILKHSLHD
jgi:hypothetical protein